MECKRIADLQSAPALYWIIKPISLGIHAAIVNNQGIKKARILLNAGRDNHLPAMDVDSSVPCAAATSIPCKRHPLRNCLPHAHCP